MQYLPAIHRVVALACPPQSTFELACPAHVFGINRPGLTMQYSFSVCTENPGLIATQAGYDMLVPDGLDTLDMADTVIVPGWTSTRQPPSPAVIQALRRAHLRGARIVSVCSGAFVLAYAGLLDRRKATTHWALADELAASFPNITVQPNVLYVDHGDVATSAGGGAGIDLCIHLVRRDLGAAYAAHLARTMVIPPHREGGQLQYAAPLNREPIEGTLAPLLKWVTARLGAPMTVQTMAAHAGVSARTLARQFTEQLGTSPGQWLLRQRIAAAQGLLESSNLPVDAIAHRVGLSSSTNLRRRFVKALGTTPGAYRRAFHAEPCPDHSKARVHS